MKINTSKVKTYVGFAVKSRKIKFGIDDIIKLKNAKLIIVSDSLAESGMKKIEGYAERISVDLIKLSEEDFKLRGSGDLFGTKQSGDMTFKIADIKEDYKILLQANKDSLEFLNTTPIENLKLRIVVSPSAI